MQFVPYIIALLIPVVVLYVIYSLDLYQTGLFKWVIACFLWGGVAFVLARYVNRYFYFNAILTRDEILRYSAPIAEEVLKALVLFYLVRRPRFTYFVDGAIYGFAVGIGFAVFENFEYIYATGDAGLGTAVSRVISTNLMHASATALTGVSVGLSRFRSGPRKAVVALSGLLAAIILHIVFNNLVTRLSGGMVLLASTILALAAVGLIAWLIFRGLTEQRR
jgi:protease PrsW